MVENHNQAADICEVIKTVERNHYKTSDEKIKAFIDEIKDPYHFKVGAVNVKVSFAEKDGMQIDECFSNFLLTL